MSRLQTLLDELCPDGVEYKPLSSFLMIRNGSDYKQFAPGEIPVYGSGGVMAYVDTAAYSKPSVLIPRKGSIDKLYYVDTPFWNVDTIFYTEIDETIALPRYVYFCLQKEHLERLNTAGGVPSLTQAVLNKVKIPIPPLPVQAEIVRILDAFMERTAELTDKLHAELIARRKQYEYYRDSLLSFDNADKSDNYNIVIPPPESSKIRVKFAKIAEIATEIYRGSGITRNQVTDCGVPCVRYGEIYTDYGVWFDKCRSHVDEASVPNGKYFEHGDILFAITGEKIEDIAKSCAYVGYERCLAGGDIVVMKHNQNPKYLSYALSTSNAQQQKSKGKTKSKVVHASIPSLQEIVIPIPPLDVQERIVAILDRFDALCNDLTSGLPAELVARRKQYEYYRDKLLSFRQLDA